MSRIRQLVKLTNSDARNASADPNALAAKPNWRSKSGSDSRTDSSSSTIDTSERVIITRAYLGHSMSGPAPARLLHFGIDRRCRQSRRGDGRDGVAVRGVAGNRK